MKVVAAGNNSYTLQVDRLELSLLNNALNEICNGIDLPEFQTRVGVPRQNAEQLLQQVHALLTRTAAEPNK